MTLVAGVDSSTQSCKVVICDAETGQVVRQASAPHPDATEVDPQHWWGAWTTASAGLLDDGHSPVLSGFEIATWNAARRAARGPDARHIVTDTNRKARFYALTAAGRRELKTEKAEWERMTTIMRTLLQDEA